LGGWARRLEAQPAGGTGGDSKRCCCAPKNLKYSLCKVIIITTFALPFKKNIRIRMLSSEEKTKIFSKHGGSDKNTGSAEAQIAMFSERINSMTKHLQQSKKDFATQLSLIKLVGKRRSLLNYLQKVDITRYRKIIADLNIRK
jgi:small subunit ribosomal protein S15